MTLEVSAWRILGLFVLLAFLGSMAFCTAVCHRMGNDDTGDVVVPKVKRRRQAAQPSPDAGAMPGCLNPDHFAQSESTRLGIPMCAPGAAASE